MENILVLVAHPDDEIMGVGGTLIKHIEQGDKVNIVIIGDGVSARFKNYEEAKPFVDEIKSHAMLVAKFLGFTTEVLGLQGNTFDQIPLLEIARIVEQKIEQYHPDIIYTHSHCDLNVDHRKIFEAVITACRPVKETNLKKIISFETPSTTEWNAQLLQNAFLPNVYVDISSVLDKKIKALYMYTKEVRPFPHPRSKEYIDALAKKRGAEAGLMAAEAFMLIKEIKR